MFDVFVLTLGISDLGMSKLCDKSSGSVATIFRVIRLLRIVRLFRLVRFLKQLYLLAFGLVEAVQAMFWVSLLMVVILYVCSIGMVRTCGSLPDTDPHAEFLHSQFADIRTSMLTLFVLMSSPNLPKYINQEGLLWSRPLLLLFLISFTIIGSFGMIALLTGVISESMFEKNQLRAEEMRKEQDELIEKLDSESYEVYASLELDENGEASFEDIILKAMPVIARLFEKGMVDFNDYNLKQLAHLMDVDSSGRVSCSEFQRVIKTYANGLKALTMQEVDFKVNCCMLKLDTIGHTLDEVTSRLDSLGSRLKTVDKPYSSEFAADFGTIPGACGERSWLVNSATTSADASTIGNNHIVVPAFPPKGLEMTAGKLGGDSERIQKGLRDLCNCVREYVQRQLAGQRDLEAALQDSIECLRSEVQEGLHTISSSPYEPTDSGSGAERKDEVVTPSKDPLLLQRTDRAPAVQPQSNSDQTNRPRSDRADDGVDPEWREGWFSNL